MAKDIFEQSVVLLTGASSGIGEAMALQLAPSLRTLILVARRKARLEQLAQKLRQQHSQLEVMVCECDVSDIKAIDAMLNNVATSGHHIDVLINNAGLGDLSIFDLSNWDKSLQMINLNITGLTYLTHRLVGPMVEKKKGGILNISSGFGMSFLPGMSVYIGTKHYVTGFTESLRLDLRGTGVFVSQCCPGPVRTEFEENTGNFTGHTTPSLITVDAPHAAKVALRGLAKNRAMTVPGFLMTLLLLSTHFTPRWVQRLFAAPLAPVLRKKQIASGK